MINLYNQRQGKRTEQQMIDKRDKLFSSQRFSLFTAGHENLKTNQNFTKNSTLKLNQVFSPSQSKQILYSLIEKREAQIKLLKKKLKTYENQMTETKHKLQTTNYELQYFKKKIYEQLQKTKQLEREIDHMNEKIIQMHRNLSCVKKLKNPLQMMKGNFDFDNFDKEIQIISATEKTNALNRINLQCLEQQVIKSAFRLKKVKSQKKLSLLSNTDQLTEKVIKQESLS